MYKAFIIFAYKKHKIEITFGKLGMVSCCFLKTPLVLGVKAVDLLVPCSMTKYVVE